MTTVPVLDLLLVVLEFVALFLATWIVWFALVIVYQHLTRRTRDRHGLRDDIRGPEVSR
ncbi:MAG TPA: hypothetical protein VN796_06170 [Acidimicrobiales bacterium]|nr:hypothetical protein [Acidimicrobiales bacterium]